MPERNERTILVTGAGGFVGGYVLNALRGRSGRVLGLIRHPYQEEKIRQSGAQAVFGDVTDPDSLHAAMKGVDAVIHTAAINRNQGQATMERVNYRGTVNLLAAAKAAGVSRFVHVIAIGADPRRTIPLPRTQGLAAEAVMGSGLPATVLETGVIYGKGDAFTSMLAGIARISPVVIIPGDGQARFEPISALDVADAAVNALEMPEAEDEWYQIAGLEVLTLNEVYEILLAKIDARRIRLHLPPRLLRPVVALMDRFFPEPPITTALLDLLGLDLLAHDNALEMLLGRPPLRFTENLDHLDTFTGGDFLAIILGQKDRRGEAVEMAKGGG
jgi:nucleoside-diphosphate-sugar epimerase